MFHANAEETIREIDNNGNFSSTSSVERRPSSSSSDEHYNVLPSRPLSYSDQLSVSQSEFAHRSFNAFDVVADSTDKEDSYDVITPTAAVEYAPISPASESEEKVAGKDDNKHKQSVSASDEHDDMLPPHPSIASQELLVRKSTDIFTDPTSTPLLTAVPTSNSASSSLPDQSNVKYVNCDAEQTVSIRSNVSGFSVGTPVIST